MESLKTIIQSNNDNVNKQVINNVHCSPTQADLIADKLELALHGGLNSRKFYCKVAYNLSEAEIWNNLEQACTGNYPQKYFTWLCQRSMKHRLYPELTPQ